MSRTEQNQTLLEAMPNGFEGSYQDVTIKTFGCVIGLLMDMSKSLAIIADSLNSEKSAEKSS